MSSVLSICIPTYMREKNIENLLTAIIPICKELSIEICISDNHSYDNTEIVVQNKKKEYDNIKYVKQSINTLTDNFYHAISLGSSEYVWLLGDNDLPPNELIQDVYERCKNRKYACIILHEKEVSYNGKEIHDAYIDVKNNKIYAANQYNEILKELGCSMHLISNVIIEKKAWDFSVNEYNILKMYFPNSEHIGAIFKHLHNTDKESVFIYDKCLSVTPVVNSKFPEDIEIQYDYEKIYGSIRRVKSWYDMFSNFERAFMNLQAFGYEYESIKMALKKREETDTRLSHCYHLFPLLHLKGDSFQDYEILINELHFCKKRLVSYINIFISRLIPVTLCRVSYKFYKSLKK